MTARSPILTLCGHTLVPITQLKWVRLGTDLDMLDAPGVLPMSFHDQLAAQRLAMCNDIGEASYVDSLVAAALLETLRELPGVRGHCARLLQRYGVPLTSTMTGEDYVHAGTKWRMLDLTTLLLCALSTQWGMQCFLVMWKRQVHVCSRTIGLAHWGGCAWSRPRSKFDQPFGYSKNCILNLLLISRR